MCYDTNITTHITNLLKQLQPTKSEAVHGSIQEDFIYGMASLRMLFIAIIF